MSNLKELRAEVKHSEALVTRKIRRMAKSKDGFDVRGTKLDPRKPKGWVERATTKQLLSYQESLKQFRRPSVGWVKDGLGRPIKRQVVKNTEAAIRRRNKSVDTIMNRLENIYMPWAGETAGEYNKRRQGERAAKRRRINDEMGIRTKVNPKRRPTSYSSERALHKYAKHNMVANTRSVVKLQISTARNNFMRLIEQVPGSSALFQLADQLTDAQFWFAWSSSTHLASASAILYELLKTGAISERDDIYANEFGSITNVIKQAAEINVKESDFWV